MDHHQLAIFISIVAALVAGATPLVAAIWNAKHPQPRFDFGASARLIRTKQLG